VKPLLGRRRRQHETAELNITAFMNLMVILVPFLLITAVFSRLAVLELNLPTAASNAANDPVEAELELEVTVRDGAIEVGDRAGGLLSRIDRNGDSYDLAALSEYLQRVKREFPDKANATLLLESDISYQVIVDVMDTMRVAELMDESNRQVVKYELFPDISIGDAPVPN
jgi:biopolymer transport protein ExbD